MEQSIEPEFAVLKIDGKEIKLPVVVRDDMGMQDAKLLDRRSFAAGGGK